MSTKLLDLVNITKSYDGVTILDDLNLYIRETNFFTLLGPSGCGKTSPLRILGGFETPDAGRFYLTEGYHPASAEQTPVKCGVPEICSFHAYDNCGKHCFRAENQRKIQSIYR